MSFFFSIEKHKSKIFIFHFSKVWLIFKSKIEFRYHTHISGISMEKPDDVKDNGVFPALYIEIPSPKRSKA